LASRTDFLAGQYFDIRVEVHAPLNGSEANGGVVDTDFALTIQKVGAAAQPASTFFKVPEPALERWNFTWYEDLFAQDAGQPSVVRVTSKAWRRLALYEPGEYVAVLKYYNGTNTTANWIVRDLATQKRAKNVILFIGDGMTTNMITAARLIGHKSINGKYQSKMAMDKFPVLGHQMVRKIPTKNMRRRADLMKIDSLTGFLYYRLCQLRLRTLLWTQEHSQRDGSICRFLPRRL
jgi:hypothetical protein